MIADGKVTASSNYDRRRKVFGKTDTEVLARLARYAKPALAGARASKIARHQYDWSLNDAGPRSPWLSGASDVPPAGKNVLTPWWAETTVRVGRASL